MRLPAWIGRRSRTRPRPRDRRPLGEFKVRTVQQAQAAPPDEVESFALECDFD